MAKIQHTEVWSHWLQQVKSQFLLTFFFQKSFYMYILLYSRKRLFILNTDFSWNSTFTNNQSHIQKNHILYKVPGKFVREKLIMHSFFL